MNSQDCNEEKKNKVETVKRVRHKIVQQRVQKTTNETKKKKKKRKRKQRPERRDAPSLAVLKKKIKSGTKLGSTETASAKARGLIPRADGTKRKSPKYK